MTPARVLQTHGQGGFSMIEMMVVVAILLVLAAAALPAYGRYALRAKRVEAIIGLSATHELQVHHHATHGEYADSYETLGRPLGAGKLLEDGSFQGPLYTFTLTTWEFDGEPNGNFRATASANLDGTDETLDIIIIENQVTVMD